MVKNKRQVGRFTIVGVVNTVIDFSVLFFLKYSGIPAVSANVVSTSAAFIFSFFANKNYTFKSTKDSSKHRFVLFIIVTLIGLWGLQSVVIAIVLPVFTQFTPNQPIALFIAKVVATIASLVWNYILYSKVVFVDSTSSSER